MTRERALSTLDAWFLYIESETTPMHMASVGFFEGDRLRDDSGNFRIDDVRRLIASRLRLVPKLRQKAVAGLLGEAPPVWMDDPEFEISQHVRVWRLPSPGTEIQLLEVCSDVLATQLDPAKPLWELVFVEGLADRRIAVIEKLHHSMADGLAAAELATVLLDLSPEPAEFDRDNAWEPPLELPVWRAAIDDLIRFGELWGRVATWSGQSVLHPLRRVKEIRRVGGAIRTLATPRIIAPKSSLNATITAGRSVHFVRLSLEEMREITYASGSTINDVLLTVVAGGLHDLLDGRGELNEKSELQALVPVGRVNESGRGLANAVSALFVRLPVGMSDPLASLRSISTEVRNDKGQHQELAASTLLALLEPLPQRVLTAIVGVVQHQPFFNLIVTNVPGPPKPLYALGAKLLEAFPIVPLVGNQSLGVAALSYEGQLNLGVFSNPATCPDIEVFCAGVEASLKALLASAQSTSTA